MAKFENRVIYLAIAFYLVGLFLFLFQPQQTWFKMLTPANILAAFITGLIFRKNFDFHFVLALFLVAVCGFFVEYAGVHTGLIFGHYSYGKTLGTGWQGIPYLIGINWACLVFFCNSTLSGHFKSPWLTSIAAGLLMSGYDFLLEPAAIKLDMWHWHDRAIPLKNYVAWFVFSVLFSRLYLLITKSEKNRVAAALFFIQACFFLILRLLNS